MCKPLVSWRLATLYPAHALYCTVLYCDGLTCTVLNCSAPHLLCLLVQVFLAEWMGTQVAAKQLLSFQEKAKDEVSIGHVQAQHAVYGHGKYKATYAKCRASPDTSAP